MRKKLILALIFMAIIQGPSYAVLTHDRLIKYDAAQRTADSIVQESAGNIGISSISPGATLDVAGSIRGTSIGVGTYAVCNVSGNCPSGVSSGTINQVAKFAATGQVVSGSPVMIDNGTNIGIGSTAPQARLVVIANGTTSDTNAFSVRDSSFNSKFLINDAGNIGVGSLSPGASLDIQGTERNTGMIANGNVGVGTTFTTSNALTIMNGNVGIGTWNQPYNLYVKPSGNANGAVVVDSNGNVGIGTNITNSSGGALIIMGGNVGIGTLQAATMFRVQGSAVVTGSITANTTANALSGTTFGGSQVSSSSLVGIGTINSDAIINLTTTRTITVNQSAEGFLFKPVFTEGASGVHPWISSVGIGTFVITNGAGATANAAGLLIEGPPAGTATPGSVYAMATLAGNNMFMGNVGIGTIMTGNVAGLTVIGNVGVGTWLPVSGLSVMNGNIGIGTWKPVNSLDVNGAGTFGYVNTTAPANGLLVSGNVGVGSTAPGTALDANGTVRATGGILSGNVGIGTIQIAGGLVNQHTQTEIFGDGVNGIFRINDAGTVDTTPTIDIGAGGNIGIGTTNVGNKLLIISAFQNGTTAQINSNSLTGGVGLLIPTTSSTFAGQLLSVSSSSNTSTVTGDLIRTSVTGASSNGVALHVANGGTGQTVLIEDASIGTDTTPFIVDAAGNIGIATSSAPGGQLIIASGNVGIDSASPGSVLDIQGTMRTTGLQLNLAPLAGGNVLVSNTLGVGTWMPPSTITAGGGSGTVTSSTINQVARFNATGTTVQGSTVLSDDGTHIGIGTTSATRLFEIYGSGPVQQITNTTAGSAANIYFKNDLGDTANISFGGSTYNCCGAANDGARSLVIGPGTTSGSLIFTYGAGTKAMTIPPSGNVGIGTVNPARLFEVFSSSGASVIQNRTTNAASPASIYMRNDGSNFGYVLYGGSTYDYGPGANSGANELILANDSTTGGIILGTGASITNRLRVTAAGLVGIGTTIPATTLDVKLSGSTPALDGSQTYPLQVHGAEISPSLGMTVTTSGPLISIVSPASGTDKPLMFSGPRAGSAAIAISPSGNVGIGTYSSLTTKFMLQQAADSTLGTDGTSNFRIYNAAITSFGQVEMDGKDLVISASNASGTTGSVHLNTNRQATPNLTAYPGGNIGIGSIAPVAALDIPGTSATVNVIRMQSADGTFWKCKPANATGVFTCT